MPCPDRLLTPQSRGLKSVRKSISTYLFLLLLSTFIILLLFFIGFKIWVGSQFNKDGNLLLVVYPDSWRLYEITKSKLIVWDYDLSKQKSDRTVAGEMIRATRLKNGNTLILDPELNAVYEVNKARKIIWRCEQLKDGDTVVSNLSYPSSAQRLPNGNTLIADTDNGRVVEVTRGCRIVWKYICSESDSHVVPTRALKFPDTRVGMLVSTHTGFEYREVEPSSNRIVRKVDLEKFITPQAGILENKHILIALPFAGAGAIELDTLGRIVWRFEPEVGVLTPAKGTLERWKTPRVYDVYPTYKKNLFIYTQHGTLEVTPAKEVVWKLSADEGIKNILGIKFFKKGIEDPFNAFRSLAGIVQH